MPLKEILGLSFHPIALSLSLSLSLSISFLTTMRTVLLHHALSIIFCFTIGPNPNCGMK
jgi:hypothetical protein